MNNKEMRNFEISYIQNKISSINEMQSDIFDAILKRKNLVRKKLTVLNFKDYNKNHYFYTDGNDIIFIVTFNIRIDGFIPILSVIEELPKETYDKCRMTYNIQINNIY